MSVLRNVSAVILIIGGINWGLIGLFQFNLVASLFGEMSLASRTVYVLVGISALYQAFCVANEMSRLPATTANAGSRIG